ncbi:IucA/IucC family C-terminal-domain containing protein [Candidatus Williamhamiltonella defendens]|uniref:IucA/IucC family C-terminal-domain containing protein n=1 Tax=Candidatus Williamhamiltonella defendens TaxID=138072 RepID=UPI00130E227E|nr:IucA/IucC family C-terminal-domain containing protein [Candidatus Hamiltonella defensa]
MRTFVVYAYFLIHLHELALCLTSYYNLDTPVLWKILREVTVQVFNALKNEYRILYGKENEKFSF